MEFPQINNALSAIQQSLFVPKGNRNNFGGYNYRSCEDILRAVKPLLSENKCALRMTEDMVQLGERIYVKATAIITSLVDGTDISVSAFAMEPKERKGMDAAQVSGSSLSYARKYALAGLFGIDNERDPDATNDHGAQTQHVTAAQILAPKKPSKKQEAWNAYKKMPANEGVDAASLANGFRAFCMESCDGKDVTKFDDNDWRQVISMIEAV